MSIISEMNKCPPGLEPMIGTTMLFLRRAHHLEVPFAELYTAPEYYDIVSSDGFRLYTVTETTDIDTRRLDAFGVPYFLEIIGFDGTPILYLGGDGERCGNPGPFKVTYIQGYLGQVGATPLRACNSPPTLQVFNASGQSEALLVAEEPANCRGFEVDGTTLLGQITSSWDKHQRRLSGTSDGTFGIWFPIELEVRLKALLMATAVMIDFQCTHRDFPEYNRRRRRRTFPYFC